MASTLRALWALGQWAWRGLAYAGRGVRWAARELGPLVGPAAPGDWLRQHAAVQQWPAGLEGEVRRLAAVYRQSFCGECAGGPDYPQGRCPKCLEKLGRLLEQERAA